MGSKTRRIMVTSISPEQETMIKNFLSWTPETQEETDQLNKQLEQGVSSAYSKEQAHSDQLRKSNEVDTLEDDGTDAEVPSPMQIMT